MKDLPSIFVMILLDTFEAQELSGKVVAGGVELA